MSKIRQRLISLLARLEDVKIVITNSSFMGRTLTLGNSA